MPIGSEFILHLETDQVRHGHVTYIFVFTMDPTKQNKWVNDMTRMTPPVGRRAWIRSAIERLSADYARSADTHLIRLDQRRGSDVAIYLKDESAHPSGSLKHRLARSLFVYCIANGWIH